MECERGSASCQRQLVQEQGATHVEGGFEDRLQGLAYAGRREVLEGSAKKTVRACECSKLTSCSQCSVRVGRRPLCRLKMQMTKGSDCEDCSCGCVGF